MSIITVGIDLSKNVFAVHGVDENGKAALVKSKAISPILHTVVCDTFS